MRRRLDSGTSLIEILVVIVVFLVGILAIVQAFPPGFALLRTTRSNTVAAALAKAEMQRLQGNPDQLPEIIAPAVWNGTVITLVPERTFANLMPPTDAGTGRLDPNGNILVGGSPIGNWQRISMSNSFTRVIGEGRVVPAPRQVGPYLGGLIQFNFGPMFYFRDAGTGIGNVGVLQVYGNDLVRRIGNLDRWNPNPFRPAVDFQYFFIEADDAGNPDTTVNPFPNVDQVWVPKQIRTGGATVRQPIRVSFNFTYDVGGGNFAQYDVVILADPNTMPDTVIREVGSYWAINLQNLVSYPGVYGTPAYTAAQFIGADFTSMRVQRVYEELPLAAPFDPALPLQYKVTANELGAILVNPAAYNVKVRGANNIEYPLMARADYSVYDWRIIRDDFRGPEASDPAALAASGAPIKLGLQSIKPASGLGPDLRAYAGLGFQTPNVSLVLGSQDFVLVDLESGGVLLGNQPGATGNSYSVQKREGTVTFNDVRPDLTGIQARVSYPQPDGTWSAPVDINITGRSLRALYMARGEWSVQTAKAANFYRVSGFSVSGMRVGEVYVGSSSLDLGGTPIGDATRLYFPLSELGNRIVVAELWYTLNGSIQVLRDQEFQIEGIQTIAGVPQAFADIRAKVTSNPADSFAFNFTRNGYSVRGVKGSSMKVRVLWNPDSFNLTASETNNFLALEQWMRSTRRIQVEGFVAGALK